MEQSISGVRDLDDETVGVSSFTQVGVPRSDAPSCLLQKARVGLSFFGPRGRGNKSLTTFGLPHKSSHGA